MLTPFNYFWSSRIVLMARAGGSFVLTTLPNRYSFLMFPFAWKALGNIHKMTSLDQNLARPDSKFVSTEQVGWC